MGALELCGYRRDAMPAAPETKSVDISPDLWAALNGGWGVPTKSGQQVGGSTSVQVTAFYRAMLVIAEGISQLPVELYKTSGRGAEPAKDHPLYDLLMNQPSLLQDGVGFWTTMLMFASGAGDAVAYRVVVNGQLRELIPIRPECVQIDIDQLMRPIYDLTFEKGGFASVGANEVFHLRGPSWMAHRSLDPRVVGREAIGLARATEESHARLHANGAQPAGILSTEQKLNKDQIETLRSSWQQAHGGTSNVGKTAIMSGGLKWTQTSMNGVHAEHLDTRKHQIEEIARLMGVFPIMLGHSGDQSPTFASADAFMAAHVRHTLQPWIKRVRSAIETQLLTKDERLEGYHVRIDTSELLRGSLEARSAYYKAALGTNSSPGWLSVNEVREDDGWDPTEGEMADRPLTPEDYAALAAANAPEAEGEKPASDKKPESKPDQM